jgi:hypothetical protein
VLTSFDLDFMLLERASMLQGGNPKQGGVLIFLVIYLMAIGLGM